MKRRLAAAGLVIGLGASISAQPPPSARDSAPIDVTGYWVSYVTENWRYRMVTPAKGEYRRIPASPAALPLINAWDPAADEKAGNQCKSYGAAAIMNVPGRLHITWQDANTLRIDTDAGTQTRRFRFPAATAAKPSPASWQGESSAQWTKTAGNEGGSSLRVVTTNMRAGYLRKNGVPYSVTAVLTEYFAHLMDDDGTRYLTVTTMLEDPVYLQQPWVRTSQFRKQPDAKGWNPTPCSAR